MNYILKIATLTISILLVIPSCGSNTERESILVGSTFKIEESEKFQTDMDVVYQWWIGNAPEQSDYMFRVHGDKAFLTPDIKGNYDVFASIRDSQESELQLLEFYFTAVPDTLLNVTEREVPVEPREPEPAPELESIIENASTETEQKKPTVSEKSVIQQQQTMEEGWTVQVSSRPSINAARNDKNFLIENGFDAYIQKVEFKDKNQTWFRVRVGNFSDKTIAKEVKKQISTIWKHDIWIDRVRAE